MSRPIVFLSAAVVCFCLVAPFAFAAEKVIEPFNGKNLDGWKLKGSEDKSFWTVGIAKMSEDSPRELVVTPADGAGEMVNAKGHGVDMYSEAEFGDCLLTIEVMVPKGSNSGIYLMGNYEIQILDSFGKELHEASKNGTVLDFFPDVDEHGRMVDDDLPFVAKAYHEFLSKKERGEVDDGR